MAHAAPLARVNHPAIVSVFTVQEVFIPEQGCSFPAIVMEWIDGQTFGKRLSISNAILAKSRDNALEPANRIRSVEENRSRDWLDEIAKPDTTPDEVIKLLDTQAYFDLQNLPYPTTQDHVIESLFREGLLSPSSNGWNISNLAAISLAKRLDGFSRQLARKAPRFVMYKGTNKMNTKSDHPGVRGYIVGFENLVEFVHKAAPRNRHVEEAIRQEFKMFPKQALRELVANALVHQDFSESGTSVMVEMYDDRIEISNPGLPFISLDRFIDEHRSRNERMADLFRRCGICEEKGSGVDKVVNAAELFQLRAPDFRVGEVRTTSILFAYQKFNDMNKTDRIRACYQHCVLQYLSCQRMSNQSLRDRFRLPESKSATISLILAATKDAGRIKLDESDTTSTRYARYLPFWA